jgi:competence ComEA-like helix-hairpin-helix protein
MAERTKPAIDLNTADEAALQELEGIDVQRARLIIDYRESQGPIENWEQLELLDGIGPELTEELKASASLGESDAPTEGGSADGQPLDPEQLIEALIGLAELDSEAAAAYAVASEAIAEDDLRAKLREFRQDHLRHVRDLNGLIERAGGESLEGLEPDEAFLATLAETATPLGARGLLIAMIGNEMLTNGTYATALDLPHDQTVRRVLERNYADEQRHLRWLLDAREELNVGFPAEPGLTS